jgi:uroporphyrinogen-III decarboxylase
MTDEEREGGAWIGQHPDANTEKVRRQLDEGAERVAVTDNESGALSDEDQDDWPTGHREGNRAGDDDVREAGENR